MLIYHLRNKFYDSLNARGGKTLVLDIKFPDFSSNIAPLNLTAKVGLAICHMDDNYNRKIGRELALANLQERSFRLAYVCDNDITYISEFVFGSCVRSVSFTVNKINKKARMNVHDIDYSNYNIDIFSNVD